MSGKLVQLNRFRVSCARCPTALVFEVDGGGEQEVVDYVSFKYGWTREPKWMNENQRWFCGGCWKEYIRQWESERVPVK